MTQTTKNKQQQVSCNNENEKSNDIFMTVKNILLHFSLFVFFHVSYLTQHLPKYMHFNV